jgi:hypothetical protein
MAIAQSKEMKKIWCDHIIKNRYGELLFRYQQPKHPSLLILNFLPMSSCHVISVYLKTISTPQESYLRRFYEG